MKDDESIDARLQRIADDPKYRELVAKRSKISWILSSIVLVIFFGYMLLVAFAGPFLGTRISNMTTTIGIPIGIFVILSSILLTGIYVRLANRRFDAEVDAILREHGE